MARRRYQLAHPAFGALSRDVKDNLYQLENGIVFTSPWVVTRSTRRFHAMILLSAGTRSFTVRAGGNARNYRAVAIRPLTERGLRAENAQLVSVHVKPDHPLFRAFRTIPEPGLLALPHDAFAPLGSALGAAYRGELTLTEADRLLDAVVRTTLPFLPVAKPVDERVELAIKLLREDPPPSLRAVARAVGLSYYRMSRLFSEAIGIPLRVYLLAQKVQKMASMLGSSLPLTDIAYASGFTDLAHMTRVTQQFHGAPPAYFVQSDCVRVFCWAQTGQRDRRRVRNAAYAIPTR